MFCPNCGTNNPDGSKFCSECGTVFEAEAAAEAVTETAKQTVDQIIEGITPTQTGEGEKPTVDQIIEEIAPEKPDLTKKTESAETPAVAEPTAEPVPEPAQPAAASIPAQPAQAQVQPVPQQIPAPPVAPQMPQQPPAYAQPYPQQPAAPKPPKPPRKPLDAKQKKLLVIGGSCGAVLLAFLIVLFTAIIPHAGLKGKLRYSWTRVDSSRTNVLNLKKKTWTMGNKTYKIKSWKTSGDRVQFNYTEDGLNFETQTFVVAFSPDGKKVYFFDAYGYDDGDRPDYVFARGNYVQNNLSDLIW